MTMKFKTFLDPCPLHLSFYCLLYSVLFKEWSMSPPFLLPSFSQFYQDREISLTLEPTTVFSLPWFSVASDVVNCPFCEMLFLPLTSIITSPPLVFNAYFLDPLLPLVSWVSSSSSVGSSASPFPKCLCSVLFWPQSCSLLPLPSPSVQSNDHGFPYHPMLMTNNSAPPALIPHLGSRCKQPCALNSPQASQSRHVQNKLIFPRS